VLLATVPVDAARRSDVNDGRAGAGAFAARLD
jgi:hypothetical protein